MIAYLSLGSNLGDREAYLHAAVSGLRKRGVELCRSSAVYQTEPRDVIDQPWFLNTVLESSTILDPELLLGFCLEIERENHRLRDGTKGPRTLDVDIILYGSHIIKKDHLVIPHPRYADRRFVLKPLAEIAPALVDPVRGVTILELLAATADPAIVEKVAPPLF